MKTHNKYVITGYSLYFGVYTLGIIAVQITSDYGLSQLGGTLAFMLPLINWIVAFLILFDGEQQRSTNEKGLMLVHTIILSFIALIWFIYIFNLWIQPLVYSH